MNVSHSPNIQMSISTLGDRCLHRSRLCHRCAPWLDGLADEAPDDAHGVVHPLDHLQTSKCGEVSKKDFDRCWPFGSPFGYKKTPLKSRSDIGFNDGRPPHRCRSLGFRRPRPTPRSERTGTAPFPTGKRSKKNSALKSWVCRWVIQPIFRWYELKPLFWEMRMVFLIKQNVTCAWTCWLNQHVLEHVG